MKFSLRKDPFRAREKLKYAKPIPSREYILQCLEQLGKPATCPELITAFGVRHEDAREALRRRLLAMTRDGQLIVNRRGSFVLVDKTSLVRGRVVGHKDGFGFLIPEDGGTDIFLSPKQMRLVFPNDRILVQVIDPNKKGKREGIIVEILERNTKQVVGRYFTEDNVTYIQVANKNINQEVLVSKDEGIEVQSGQMVVAEIISYPTMHRQAIAKIIEILGEHMAPGMEEEVTMRAYNLPHVWVEDVLQEVSKFPKNVAQKDWQTRKDLRSLPLVTIDGIDAKDFDDAVYCARRIKGGWDVYVAIADVGHYVGPGSAVDKEALLRGNSVYFPQRVIPMLPEALSNELCSLKPNVDRLCMVCEMVISKDGKITRYKFYEAVMCSHARLTYDEVGAFLNGKGHKIDQVLLPHIKELHELFKVLDEQRIIRGALALDRIETKIIFDAKKKIKNIVPVVRNVAHSIIEECMIAANVCAARFLWHKKIPALYRVHAAPDAEKLTNLKAFLHSLGLSLSGGEKPKPLDYAQLLNKIKGRKDEHLVQTILLRSMRQAVYDEENLGHFGLAYEAYGHFTSPIRRYPDLLTHRAIRHVLNGGEMANFQYQSNEIHNFGEHCSMTDRRADEATYSVVDWLKCEYMRAKVGGKFVGIISGVTNFGLFVELKDIYVEGLVHITALPNDYYEFDPIKYCLTSRRSKKVYRLGDEIKIQVQRVDLDNREIDFGIVS